MKAMTSAASVLGLIVLALGGCTAGNGASGPAATATHTVTSTQTVIKEHAAAPAPTATQTVTEPAPTVTQTVTAPAATAMQTSSAASSGQGGSGGQGKGHVITRLNGSGTQNTGSFTTPSNWALSWSYWGCPGGMSNFQVTEYNTDGSPDFNGVSVNELGTGRGPVATYAYGDPGTHYLSVNTEGCSWSLVPVTV